MNKFSHIHFYAKFRDYWLKSGLSREQFARRIGVNRKSIGNWLNGDSLPKTAQLCQICNATGTVPGYWLTK